MTKYPQICFVANSISKKSVPAKMAIAITEHTDATVDILTWFSAESVHDDRLRVRSLDAPRTVTGMDRETYRKARDILSSYDLVQTHQNHSGAFAKIIARSLGVPTVSREGNTRDGFTRKGRIANGLTNPLSEYVVCNSQAVFNSLAKWERALLASNQIRIIPNGVDLENVQNALNQEWNVRDACKIDTSTVLIGNAASLTEQKAHDVLIRALKIANERSDQRYELVIAGDGPLRSEIEARITTEGLSDYVHLLGLIDRDRVYQMMDNLDVYAMPSRWEGFANAAIEACGVGNACVFSEIDAFTIPFDDAALFHPVDDADALADRIITLGESPELRKEHAERGKSLVEQRYALPEIAHQYRALYRDVLGY